MKQIMSAFRVLFVFLDYACYAIVGLMMGGIFGAAMCTLYVMALHPVH